MERLHLTSANVSTDGELFKESPEQLCHTELSLPQIRSFVDFCKEKGCKDKYGAYEIFATDVPEQDKEKSIDTTFLKKMEIEGLSHFSDRNFEQIRYFTEDKKTDDEISPTIYGRLYISPSVENTPILMQRIIEQHHKNSKDLACKISRTGGRNDRIVLYLTNNFSDEVSIIRDIKDSSPELFVDCGKNKLWCNIEGVDDVYFGSEPSNKAFSYSEDRARIVGEIFSLQKEGLIDTDDDKELDEIFKLECLKRSVNPFNFGFYIKNDIVDDVSGKTVRISSAADDVLYGHNYGEFRQEDEYLGSKVLVDKWLEDNMRLPEETWLGNDVPKFNNG